MASHPSRLAPSEQTPSAQYAAKSADLAAGWALLHEAGAAIADLAQLGPEPMPHDPRSFALRAAAAGPARLALAEQGVDDCAAALHSGLCAISDACAAGADCTAAALTLWREFDRARAGLLELIAPPGA